MKTPCDPASAATAPESVRGHRRRLRERFLKGGLEGFHDYEIIELLLTLGTPQKDCKPAAKAAMAHFKSLPAVFEAPPEALAQVAGIGSHNAIALRLVKAVADRYLSERLIDRPVLNDSRALFDFLYHTLRDLARERFVALFLDAKNRVLDTATLSEGSLTASAVYPREVIQAALERRAAALIFAHNHPSGDPAPSADDVALTRRLVFACRAVGITVHEHLVVGANRYYSFADQGRIAAMNRRFEATMAEG
jgi:DNA repair protein RadC